MHESICRGAAAAVSAHYALRCHPLCRPVPCCTDQRSRACVGACVQALRRTRKTRHRGSAARSRGTSATAATPSRRSCAATSGIGACQGRSHVRACRCASARACVHALTMHAHARTHARTHARRHAPQHAHRNTRRNTHNTRGAHAATHCCGRQVREGDVVVAIDGKRLSEAFGPEQCLESCSSREVAANANKHTHSASTTGETTATRDATQHSGAVQHGAATRS